jgi:hypothetical protein
VQGSGDHGGRGGQPRGLAEVLLVLSCYAIFAFLHASAGKDVASATANAHVVQSVERALHLDVELITNAWLNEHVRLARVAVLFYRSYYLVVFGVLAWVFVRHGEVYLKVRRTLLAMFFLILPVYWALPLSPPRFALPGAVDLVALYDPFGIQASRETTPGQNHYSAMPSLHVGLSAWCAYAAWSALRTSHPRLALLPWLFPLAMTAVVFGTGNHYVLDVVGSVALLLASIGAASVWEHLVRRRIRP